MEVFAPFGSENGTAVKNVPFSVVCGARPIAANDPGGASVVKEIPLVCECTSGFCGCPLLPDWMASRTSAELSQAEVRSVPQGGMVTVFEKAGPGRTEALDGHVLL